MIETIWFTGLSGSGKTTIGKELIKFIENSTRKPVLLLDGDNLRDGLNVDLGFSAKDRFENIRRASEVAKLFNEIGIIVIATFITPTNDLRDLIKDIIPNVKFIYLETSLEVCEARDPKGLYAKARAGIIPEFTGVSAPFDDMDDAWLRIDTADIELKETVGSITKYIEKL